MNERTALSWLPLFQTEATVIKCDAVDMQRFTVGSIDTNKLWREAQYLAKFLITSPRRLETYFPERLYYVLLLLISVTWIFRRRVPEKTSNDPDKMASSPPRRRSVRHYQVAAISRELYNS